MLSENLIKDIQNRYHDVTTIASNEYLSTSLGNKYAHFKISSQSSLTAVLSAMRRPS